MGIFSRIFKREQPEEDTAVRVSVIIPAAGSGTRMGSIGDRGKLFVNICGQPVLAHTLGAFEEAEAVDEVIVVTRESDMLDISDLVADYGYTKVKKIVSGGATRQQSVAEGLQEIAETSETVVIHDGARPFITPEEIDEVVTRARETGAAAVGVPVTDTIKLVTQDMKIERTVDRRSLYAIRTPQAFEVKKYRQAIKEAQAAGQDFTDDCQLFEHKGHPVFIVKGSPANIKITTPADIAAGEAILRGGAF